MTAYDIASSRSHAAVCQLLEQYGYKVASIIMVPLTIIITVLSHSRVIVILCQPLSSQLATIMPLSQAYRLSEISWSTGLNCLISLLNIKKVILFHNNICMMKLYHRIERFIQRHGIVSALSIVCSYTDFSRNSY